MRVESGVYKPRLGVYKTLILYFGVQDIVPQNIVIWHI